MKKIVIKYNGLCNGKGVFICSTTEESMATIDRLFSHEWRYENDPVYKNRYITLTNKSACAGRE